jgi:hypothetical protein
MPDRDPGDRPPRRLLERAPSERYTAGGPAGTAPSAAGAARSEAGSPRAGGIAAGPGDAGSVPRAFLLGLVAAAIGATVHVAVAVLLLATGGLLVVAATLGFVVGALVRKGAGLRVRAGARRSLGVTLAIAAIAAALAVNWALSGAYLGPFDFLDQVYGPLVPLQVAAAAAGALAGTR